MTTEQSLTAEGKSMTDTTKRLTREQIEARRKDALRIIKIVDGNDARSTTCINDRCEALEMVALCDMALSAIPAQSEPVSEERICELAEGVADAFDWETDSAHDDCARITAIAIREALSAHPPADYERGKADGMREALDQMRREHSHHTLLDCAGCQALAALDHEQPARTDIGTGDA